MTRCRPPKTSGQTLKMCSGAAAGCAGATFHFLIFTHFLLLVFDFVLVARNIRRAPGRNLPPIGLRKLRPLLLDFAGPPLPLERGICNQFWRVGVTDYVHVLDAVFLPFVLARLAARVQVVDGMLAGSEYQGIELVPPMSFVFVPGQLAWSPVLTLGTFAEQVIDLDTSLLDP